MSTDAQAPIAWRIGGRYNWRYQPERLVYLGRNFSGNGFWHQFAKVDSPDVVWCEVLDEDLRLLEETKADEPGTTEKNAEGRRGLS